MSDLTYPEVLGETTDPTPAAAEPAAPAPAEPAPPAPAPTPAPGELADSPWKADLESTFQDPAQRAAVDQFLRTNVQPRVTQLEQATATNRDAERLWNDFVNNPEDTFNVVATELFGEEDAGKIKELISSNAEGETPNLTPAEQATAAEQVQDPRIQAVIDDYETRQAVSAYETQLAETKAAHEGDTDKAPIKDELFAPFVVSADGDFEAAYDNYQNFVKTGLDEFKPGETTPDPAAPPTTESGQTAPPEKEHYGSLDEAVNAWMEEKKQAPPVV